MNIEEANKLSQYYKDKWINERKARKILLKTSEDFKTLEENIKSQEALITTAAHARDIMKSQQMTLINEYINKHLKK